MKRKPEFDELVRIYSREIFTYLWRMLGDNELAEDCLQEVYLRGFKAYARLDDEANFRAWLYKIATNTAYTLREREAKISSKHLTLDDVEIEDKRTPHEDFDVKERLEKVAKAVASLPEMQRSAIVLRKYQELTYSEIALILNCSESSARANVYQGLKKLRSRFAKKLKSGVMR